jgi:tRNA(adenine34) deaminase
VRGTRVELDDCMEMALEEAEQSLREGNHGFGAVVARDGTVIARAHDTEATKGDPTLHAEITAVSMASRVVGPDLASCTLVSTHEPCPMCAGAIAWAKIGRVAWGYGIADALRQGRDRIPIECGEILRRAGAGTRIETGVLGERCAVLYDRAVRKEIGRLRGATDAQLAEYDRQTAVKRVAWFKETGPRPIGRNLPETAYRLLLEKLGIREEDAPIESMDSRRLVFHSKNPCPTLEACRILRLDTRRVCRLSNEGATDQLVRQVDPGLRFSRNYQGMRPYGDSCVETIELVD